MSICNNEMLTLAVIYFLLFQYDLSQLLAFVKPPLLSLPPVSLTFLQDASKSYSARLLLSFLRLEAMANSPSAEAGGVGKAYVWLTPVRDNICKRTKRPTYLDAILMEVASQEERYLPSVLVPSCRREVLNVWTAPLRSSRPLVLKLPRMLRAGNREVSAECPL